MATQEIARISHPLPTADGGEKCGLALAIWVKTPGCSPVKTRLAAALGEAQATAIYEQCVTTTASLAAAAHALEPSLRPHWAVAEPEALDLPCWQAFPRVAQGPGTLGERLARVYRSLIGTHAAVLFIGADAPQFDPEQLAQTGRCLADGRCDFVLGRAADGGFWLFAGRRALPDAVWTDVAYSQADTADALAVGVAGHGHLAWVDTLQDLDRAEDLPAVTAALRGLSAPLPEQSRILAMLEGVMRRA